MTPTATYIAEENCLQEISQVEKPRKPEEERYAGRYMSYLNAQTKYSRDISAYNAHLATLRKIPCDPSCKGLWADGQKLVVGKDYEVRDYPIRAMLPTDPKFIAFPLVPVKSEDASLMGVWKELLEDSKNGFADLVPGSRLTLNDWHKVYDNAIFLFIEHLNTHYSLTKI